MLTKILLIMDVIVTLFDICANLNLLSTFIRVNPDVSHRDYYLINAFYIVFLGFQLLAGVVMMCIFDEFQYFLEWPEDSERPPTKFFKLCNLLLSLLYNLIMIIKSALLGQVLYKLKMCIRGDED